MMYIEKMFENKLNQQIFPGDQVLVMISSKWNTGPRLATYLGVSESGRVAIRSRASWVASYRSDIPPTISYLYDNNIFKLQPPYSVDL